jgi:hypothetical protein
MVLDSSSLVPYSPFPFTLGSASYSLLGDRSTFAHRKANPPLSGWKWLYAAGLLSSLLSFTFPPS